MWSSQWVSVCVCVCVCDCIWVHGCLDKMHMAIKECTKLASVLIVTNIMNTLTRFFLWSRVYICKTGLVARSLAREDIHFKEDIFSGKRKKKWDQNQFKSPIFQKHFVFYWFIYKTFYCRKTSLVKLLVSSLIIITTSILSSCKRVVHKHINTELVSTLFPHSGEKHFNFGNLTSEIYSLLPNPHWKLMKTI